MHGTGEVKTAALVLAAAVMTGCATPQRQRSFAEGPQVGQEHIEAAKTDVYTVLMRYHKKIRGWFVFRW